MRSGGLAGSTPSRSGMWPTGSIITAVSGRRASIGSMRISRKFNARRRIMAAKNELNPEPADRVLVIKRTFDAPLPVVWKAWAEPQQALRWWGPRGFTVPFHKLDMRVGGSYRCCLRSPDGVDHWQRGVYREIV